MYVYLFRRVKAQRRRTIGAFETHETGMSFLQKHELKIKVINFVVITFAFFQKNIDKSNHRYTKKLLKQFSKSVNK